MTACCAAARGQDAHPLPRGEKPEKRHDRLPTTRVIDKGGRGWQKTCCRRRRQTPRFAPCPKRNNDAPSRSRGTDTGEGVGATTARAQSGGRE